MHCISKFKNGAFFVVISMLLFASCKRNPDVSPYFTSDDNGGYASDASKIEWANDDVISIADAAGTFYSSGFIAGCATVATDTISEPHTLIIRFGNTDCVCPDGRKRSGSIIVSYSGNYTDSNKIHTITFDNYYINDNQLNGSVQLTRVDTTVAGDWYYNVQVDETLDADQSSPADIESIKWTGTLVRKWVTGFATGDRSDDVFSISGSATLLRPNGNPYTFSIAVPLQVALDCNYIESGVVNIAGYSGGRILNYGSGTCDDKAQVTLDQDNSIHQITLMP